MPSTPSDQRSTDQAGLSVVINNRGEVRLIFSNSNAASFRNLFLSVRPTNLLVDGTQHRLSNEPSSLGKLIYPIRLKFYFQGSQCIGSVDAVFGRRNPVIVSCQ
jgi:hypothetical protein